MILIRPAVCFDLETTDPDPATCALFDYGAVLLLPDGTRKPTSMRFKPWKPILPEVEELTGVTNAMVEECPPFSEHAERVWQFMKGKDIIGYNVRNFDLIVLDEEIRRATNGRLKLDLAGISVIDCFSIYQQKSPRKLEDAVRAYCGREHAGAHGAEVDAMATADVFLGQLKAHEDLETMDLEELATFCLRDKEKIPVDVAGKLYRDKAGELRFNFGKNVDQLVRENSGYCTWMSNASFPGSTMEAIEEELDRLGLLRGKRGGR